VDLDYRYAAGDVEQLKTLAQELMALNLDVYGGRGGDIGVGPAPAILPGLGGARCLPAPGPAKRTSESRCGGNWACQGRGAPTPLDHTRPPCNALASIGSTSRVAH
jgi:hypothetical protein